MSESNVIDPVDREAYIGNAVGICFWLFLVNVVSLSANPAWQRLCCSCQLKCWRHIKTWPPPWLSGCMANEDVEDGAGVAEGSREDAFYDTSFWGWHGLDARHITDGLLGLWGMLVLRTLELILFLFTMIFSAAAPDHVSATDYNGLRPHWLTYLTNWTFLVFGAQAALGLALVIVELCRGTPCCLRYDSPLLENPPSYDDAHKAPRNHQQRLPFPPPPHPAPVPMTAGNAIGPKSPPMQALGDSHQHSDTSTSDTSTSVSPSAKPMHATGNGGCSTPPVYPTRAVDTGWPQVMPKVSVDNPVRHTAVPPPPANPDPPAPSAPPPRLLFSMPSSSRPSSPSSPTPLASQACDFSVPSAAHVCTSLTPQKVHHVSTTRAPHGYQAARTSTSCTNPAARTAARFALPPPPSPPAAPHVHLLYPPCTNPRAEAAACSALPPPPSPPAAPLPPPLPAAPFIPEDTAEQNGTAQHKEESAGEHARGDHWHLCIIPWHIKGPGCGRWWEPFMPRTDDSLPPRPLNFFEKTYLLLYQLTFVASIIVTIFFWGALAGSGDVDATNMLKHGAHAFAMLLDVILSRMPVVAFHVVVTFWYATIYSIFLFIYQIEMWRYQLVGWNDRLSPASYVVLYVIMFVLHAIMFAIVLLRDWLILALKKHLGTTSTGKDEAHADASAKKESGTLEMVR